MVDKEATNQMKEEEEQGSKKKNLTCYFRQMVKLIKQLLHIGVTHGQHGLLPVTIALLHAARHQVLDGGIHLLG